MPKPTADSSGSASTSVRTPNVLSMSWPLTLLYFPKIGIPLKGTHPHSDTETSKKTAKLLNLVKRYSECTLRIYVVGSKSFWPDIEKPRQMENAVRDI